MPAAYDPRCLVALRSTAHRASIGAAFPRRALIAVHGARALTIACPALFAGVFHYVTSTMTSMALSAVLNILGGQFKER
jgi:hypothetical protein